MLFKQFTVRGSQFFLKMCPPFLSLLVSALFCWPCSISIHLSPRKFLYFCRPGSVHALLVSALFRWPCSISIHLFPMRFLYLCLPGSALLVSPFPFICLPCDFFPFVSQVRCLRCWCPCCGTAYPPAFLLVIVSALSPSCLPLFAVLSVTVPLFLLVTVSALSPSCLPLSPFLLVTVSTLFPFCLLLFPSRLDCFVRLSLAIPCPTSLSAAVPTSALQSFAILYFCPPALSCCVRLCLAILTFVSQLWAAVSASDKKGSKRKEGDKPDIARRETRLETKGERRETRRTQ